MAKTGMIWDKDPLTGKMGWITVPGFKEEPLPEDVMQDDIFSELKGLNPSERAAHIEATQGFTPPELITATPPLGVVAPPLNLIEIGADGRPIPSGGGGPTGAVRDSGNGTGTRLIPDQPARSNVPIMKVWSDPAGPGLAFDTNAAASYLINKRGQCGDEYGYCQRRVREALVHAGLDVPRFGSAKNMVGYLSGRQDFGAVASGYGNNFYASTSSDYKPQKGDIMVYRGTDSARGGQTGPHGHIQMCVGFRADGSAVWVSDFEAKATNMSGMRDPERHGGEFVVFRQHTQVASVAPTLGAGQRADASGVVTPPVSADAPVGGQVPSVKQATLATPQKPGGQPALLT